MNRKEEITEANDVMKKTTDLFRHFDDLSLKNKDDIVTFIRVLDS